MKIIVRLKPMPRYIASSAMCSTSFSEKSDVSVSVMSRMPADSTCCGLEAPPSLLTASIAPTCLMRWVAVSSGGGAFVPSAGCPAHARTAFSAGLWAEARFRVAERSAISSAPAGALRRAPRHRA